MKESLERNKTKKQEAINNNVAISAICKDEGDYIKEWLEYHSDIGVDYFILYDNNSQVPLKKILSEYKNVEVIDWLDCKHGTQVRSQIHSINHYSYFRWIGFLDIDEYIVLLKDSVKIKDYLQEFIEYDGLCLYWLAFGSNQHKTKQTSTINSYTQSCPNLNKFNKHIKCFIDPKKYDHSAIHWTSHYIPTLNGNVDVTHTNMQEYWVDFLAFKKYMKNLAIKSTIDTKMRINHYYTRSIEDFHHKMLRGGGVNVQKVYNKNNYKSVNNENVFNDDIIQTIINLNKMKEKK